MATKPARGNATKKAEEPTKEVEQKVEIVEVDSEKEKLSKENAELKDSIAKMQEMMLQMQQTMIGLQSQQPTQQSAVHRENVYVGSNINGKTVLSDRKDGEGGLTVFGYRKPVAVTYERISKILERDKIRRLFENGLMYFSEKKWYDVFGIEVKAILNDEFVSEMLNKEVSEIRTELDRLTNKTSDTNVMHALTYRIAYLVKNGIVTTFNYDKSMLFEQYFGVPLDAVMGALVLLTDEE